MQLKKMIKSFSEKFKNKIMTTKKDDVKETKEWVSSELDKLRMKGVRVLPQPLVEVNTTASAKRTFRRGGESNRIRIEKKKHITKKSTNKDPITKISQMLHKKWLEGTWKGIDRLKLKDILEKFDETNLATLKDRLRKLNMPTNDKELHIISTYVLDVSDNETKVSSNEYSAHKLKRWAEEWTCPAPPVSESESPEFLHYMFSSIDRNISTLPEELANLCKTDHEVKVITPSRQAELLSRLGLSAHSLETSISTSDFVSKWIENQGISKTSLLSQLDSARCAVAMWRHINQDAISYSRGTKTPSVYLGGRDQGSSWREDIAIPLLRTMNIAYNDPTLFEDLPDRVSLRLRARERSRVRLYVVEEGRDLATLIEATSQIASGHSTCVVVIPSSSSSTSKGWNRAMGYLAAVASSQGVKVFTRIKAAVFEAVRIVEEDGDDEKDEQEEIKLTIKSPIKDASEAVDMKLLRNERYNNNNNNNNTDELERLREENDTLKTELGALDDDFFADIEDLKSRYDRAIRRIEHLDHKLRDERNEERGLRRRHESVWDTMSEQLYEADRETSGHLAPRDFRRIVCRNLGLEREEARKLVESLPSDVYGCVRVCVCVCFPIKITSPNQSFFR